MKININRKHIHIWGDSILKGVVLDDETGTYQILSNNCVTRFVQKTNAKIFNHASFGMTTTKACQRIQRHLERNPPEPDDIVLVEFGGNDCDFHWEDISIAPQEHHNPNTPIEIFDNKIQSIINMFHSFNIDPVMMSLPPIDPDRYFKWISRGLNSSNILLWLGDVNKIYRWQEAYSNIVIEAAKKNSLPLANIRKWLLVSDHYTGLICKDGIHPNENGHEMICNAFLSYVSL